MDGYLLGWYSSLLEVVIKFQALIVWNSSVGLTEHDESGSFHLLNVRDWRHLIEFYPSC